MAANFRQTSLPAVPAALTLRPSDLASLHSSISFLAGRNIPLVDKEILDEILRGSSLRPMKRPNNSTDGFRHDIQTKSARRVASHASGKSLMVDLPREILRLISQHLDNADYLKLLYTCRALQVILIYDYFLRLGLVSTTTRTIVHLQGDVPYSAFSLLHALPVFKTNYWELNCHMYYLIHLPLSICKFIGNQPNLIDVRIEYGLDESGLLHDKRLPHVLSHLLGCIESTSCRLELCCLPGRKIGRDPRAPTSASLGRLQAAAKRSSALHSNPNLEHVTFPFSWLKIPSLVPFCRRLLAVRTIEQLTVTELASQRDLNQLFSEASLQPNVSTLSLHAKPSHYLSIPHSLARQFPRLEQLSYHDQVAHSPEDLPPHLHLPTLTYLLLTPTFSSISMDDASKLRLVHVTPSHYCLDPTSSGFCFEVAKMYRFFAILGTLPLSNVEVALWMPSGLSEHLSKDIACFCLDSLPRLKALPAKGISKIIFHFSKCSDSMHNHFLSLVPFFPNLEEVVINPNNEHRDSTLLTLLSSLGLELPSLKRLTHGKDSYVKVATGAWINQ